MDVIKLSQETYRKNNKVMANHQAVRSVYQTSSIITSYSYCISRNFSEDLILALASDSDRYI
jgi:hypothetical protein